MTPKIHSHYGEKHKAKTLSTKGDTILVKQEFKDEANINTIMKKARAGQSIVDPKTINYNRVATYEDVSGETDLQTIMNVQKAAQSAFDDLPSAIRKRFRNDPVEFYEFMHNEENAEEAAKLGLIPTIQPEPEPNPKPNPEPVQGAEEEA